MPLYVKPVIEITGAPGRASAKGTGNRSLQVIRLIEWLGLFIDGAYTFVSDRKNLVISFSKLCIKLVILVLFF